MAKGKEKISPMMQQYFDIKKDYPGVILFFRLGDFYEMFFDDARLVSLELDLVLTGRDCGQEERAPMCGVPFHSADGYIARLVSRGYKVAICEQMEDPATAKGIVKRDVIRIITPGTVIDGNMLQDGVNNYLASIYNDELACALCFADVSTGDFHITVIDSGDRQREVINQLSAYMPSEVIVSRQAAGMDDVAEFIKSRLNTQMQDDYNMLFDYNAAQKIVVEATSAKSLEDFDFGSNRQAVCALGAGLAYIKETQKSDLEQPGEIDFYDADRFMSLDASARRNLELTRSMMTGDKKHSLLWVLDKTKTAMGKRMIRSWTERPLMNTAKILSRQNAIGELCDNPMIRDEIRDAFSGINDIERILSRIVYGTANAKELKTLEITLSHLPQVKNALESATAQLLCDIKNDIDLMEDVESLISRAIVDEPPFTLREGGMIKPGYNSDIDSFKEIMDNGAGVIAGIEAKEKEKTGIPKLKVGFNRVFGYYIEVSNSYKDKVPDTYIRKQTLVNCERFITQELKDLEGKILGAKDREIALEYEVFCSVRNSVSAQMERLQKTAKAIARLDSLCSLSVVAQDRNYVCPQMTADGVIDIKDGRHPVVEALLKDSVFVPNDTFLDTDDNRCAIITGPNMAGKSTYMRQTALIVLMAQIGSFVPASSARIGICDAIYTRVGASDDLATGQSTFMVEMNEVSSILENATKNSLIILDEIGRGTSTFDGMSIARAVLEYTCKKKTLGAKTLFATHYHELTSMEGMIQGVKNYSVAVKKRGDDITFLRRIVRGGADQSFGIEVAKLAGVPDSVVKRARVILKELEKHSLPIEFKADDSIEEDNSQDVQLNFTAGAKDEIIELLKAADINVMTPIEAMQALSELSKKAREI